MASDSPRGRREAPGSKRPERQASPARTSDGETLNRLAAQTRSVSMPAADETKRLLEAAGGGDRGAQDRLLEAHLGLVVEGARRHAGEGLPAADLFQEGSIGLMAAINHFSGSGQPDFEDFARRQIDVYMNAALAAEQAVERDQAKLVEAAEDYERAEISTRRELGRKPTDGELAQKLEWSVERTRQIGEMVADARQRHDEELLQYLDPEQLDYDDEAADQGDGSEPGRQDGGSVGA